ncbi:hypothetical protein AB0F46_21670 [Streptomyces sp. NPDC026665]|uniref:hypothetical protein n=1 Tax=Streptomyces sp. NPDC026665 TaxID=3154798 RepID=UPI0033D88FD5
MSQQPTSITEASLRALLILMADHLVADEPGEPMTEAGRLQLAHQLTDGQDPHHSALLARSVFAAPGASRAEYAQLLRVQADGLDLVARYAVANARVRDLGQRIGRGYEENGEWRLAECEAEALFTQARGAGHSIAELAAASLAAREASS